VSGLLKVLLVIHDLIMLCWCAQFEKLHRYMKDLRNHTINHLLISYFINFLSPQGNEKKDFAFLFLIMLLSSVKIHS